MVAATPELKFRPTGDTQPRATPSARVALDRYIFDTLLPDLVGHDHQPSAFIVYVYLWSRWNGRRGGTVAASLQQTALDTGLSKSAVQQAVRTLERRRLVQSEQASATSVPEYTLMQPWRR